MTIWEKFPWLRPEDFEVAMVYPVSATFSGPLSAGAFSFNSRQTVLEMDIFDIVVLDGLRIAGNIDQLVFSQAIAEPFQLSLYRDATPQAARVNLRPWKFIAFSGADEFSAAWKPTQTVTGKAPAVFELIGNLNQTADLASYSLVNLFVSASIFLLKARNPNG